MAQLDGGGGDGGHKKGPGVKKAKKQSTLIDMTPLVDLGFLLITFFIFTTTLSSPSAMKLNVPKDTEKKEDRNKAKESGALTIMLGKGDQVYYYEGTLKADGSNFKSSSFDPQNGIRKVIIDKKKSAGADLVVVIKPNEEATYKSTVDILDEMKINDVEVFALVDITPNENEPLKKTEQTNGIK